MRGFEKAGRFNILIVLAGLGLFLMLILLSRPDIRERLNPVDGTEPTPSVSNSQSPTAKPKPKKSTVEIKKKESTPVPTSKIVLEPLVVGGRTQSEVERTTKTAKPTSRPTKTIRETSTKAPVRSTRTSTKTVTVQPLPPGPGRPAPVRSILEIPRSILDSLLG